MLTKEYIEYDGAYYIIGEGHKGFVADKQEDDDTYIMTLAAIAKELEARGLTEARIHLAVGLPLKWVQAQRDSFKKYLTRERYISMKYRKVSYLIEIADCTVMPQGYAAVAENLKDFMGMNMLVDVGNGIMNIMYLNNGRPIESKSWTEKLGVNQCFIRIQNHIMDTTGVKLPEEIINQFLCKCEIDVSSKYQNMVKEIAEQYVRELFDKLRDYEYNEDLMKLYVMGGGAKMVEMFGKYNPDRTTFNHDICANAKHELEKDKEILDLLVCMIADITPAHDSKLQELFDDKQEHPINVGNKKIIIFTAFADTADYLFETVGVYAKKKFGLDTALITGSVDGKTTIPGLKTDLNTVLTCFSPISKGKNLLLPNNTDEIDILIATDCISEGQNLQDCDYLINYDIHWNPVRIIQRFGRIDRIGSRNECIQLVNFWPDLTLDEYINLKARVETRMKIVDMTATGDDNVLSPEEKGDLEYRKQQLKRLQEEVVDIEEMSSGISIMDLGLNEFRLDLLDYMKTHHDVENGLDRR